jgi:hypothetical protein
MGRVHSMNSPRPGVQQPAPAVAEKGKAAVEGQPTDKSEVVPVGYNHGRGMMQNRTFAQRVARAVPSHDGTAAPPVMPATHEGAPVGHHHPAPPMMHEHGPMMGVPLGPRFASGRTQIRFVQPSGMKIAWQAGDADAKAGFTAPQLQVPARYNFMQGRIYRLKVTDIANRAGLELYPTLEVYPGNAKVDGYLSHNAVPIEFSDEDFDQVQAGNFVTKVIYLPDPQFQDLAIAGVETLVSTRLDPGVDPVQEANRRGAILAVVRIGSVDLEMPHSPPLTAEASMQMPMMAVPSEKVVVRPAPQVRQ